MNVSSFAFPRILKTLFIWAFQAILNLGFAMLGLLMGAESAEGLLNDALGYGAGQVSQHLAQAFICTLLSGLRSKQETRENNRCVCMPRL